MLQTRADNIVVFPGASNKRLAGSRSPINGFRVDDFIPEDPEPQNAYNRRFANDLRRRFSDSMLKRKESPTRQPLTYTIV
ncbi:hypothetical protein KOR42_03830 [Thalassoglobus neptunius]|uniref:Uncharacterized protein n=1 Tax=Thalassoglobus neptunius TaxID=1938619 RepID=A0A5C5X276_9PLAN|nr:hypothetical protein KOR42_03830 [Thalassoglobus neptunius]